MSKYSPKAILDKEPAAIGTAAVGVANLLVILGVVTLTAAQIAAGNVALLLVLGLFVRSQVTPNSKVVLREGEVDETAARFTDEFPPHP